MKNWTDKDLEEAASWTHLKLKGKQYKILTPVRQSSFKVQLDE